MLAHVVSALSLTLLFALTSFAHAEETHVDFVIRPAAMQDGEIQVAYEWLEPSEFRNKQLAITDLLKVSTLHPDKNHTVASKIAFMSTRSFDALSHAQMNRADFISRMLNSVATRQKGPDLWQVTNKVKAYSLPFKITFDFRFREVTAASLGAAATYLRNEASGIQGTGKERFMVLDMSNFSQLMYRNYSLVYMKEIGKNQTLVISTVVAGFNKNMADNIFNLPPISTTKKTMMGNFRSQIMQIVTEIKN